MTLHIERQSSDDWQNGVRWENRVKKIENDIEDIRRSIWWLYIVMISMGLLIIGSFLRH